MTFSGAYDHVDLCTSPTISNRSVNGNVGGDGGRETQEDSDPYLQQRLNNIVCLHFIEKFVRTLNCSVGITFAHTNTSY